MMTNLFLEIQQATLSLMWKITLGTGKTSAQMIKSLFREKWIRISGANQALMFTESKNTDESNKYLSKYDYNALI